MATTQVALALIATTLVAITLFVWATLYYVPLILYGDDHADADDHVDGSRADASRPS